MNKILNLSAISINKSKMKAKKLAQAQKDNLENKK